MPDPESDTAERLKAERFPGAEAARAATTVDLPDFSPDEEPELAATPAVAERPAEEPAGAASSSEPAQRQHKHEFDC